MNLGDTEELGTVAVDPGEVAYLTYPYRCSLDASLVSGLSVRNPISRAIRGTVK